MNFAKAKKKIIIYKKNCDLREGVHVDNWGPCGPSHNNKRVTVNSELVIRPCPSGPSPPPIVYGIRPVAND
jgi:hypothetical protein